MPCAAVAGCTLVIRSVGQRPHNVLPPVTRAVRQLLTVLRSLDRRLVETATSSSDRAGAALDLLVSVLDVANRCTLDPPLCMRHGPHRRAPKGASHDAPAPSTAQSPPSPSRHHRSKPDDPLGNVVADHLAELLLAQMGPWCGLRQHLSPRRSDPPPTDRRLLRPTLLRDRSCSPGQRPLRCNRDLPWSPS